MKAALVCKRYTIDLSNVPCKIYRPDNKAKVESKIKYVKNNSFD